MKPFTYIEPELLPEALALLAQYGDEAKVIAGGTALVNFMKHGLIEPRVVVGLRRLKPLRQISASNEIRIGALATLHNIQTSPLILSHAPLLAEACRHVATVRVRSMATIGGALAFADPALDTPPALIVLDGKVRLRSQHAERDIPADRFFKGIFESALEPQEIISEVTIPAQPTDCGCAFLKFAPATHDDYATVCVAVRVTITDGRICDARIALGAVGTTPIRAVEAEPALRGFAPDEKIFSDVARMTAESLQPVTNLRSSSEYKRAMVVVFVRRALDLAAKRAIGLVPQEKSGPRS